MIAITAALIINWLLFFHEPGLGAFISTGILMMTVNYYAIKKQIFNKELIVKNILLLIASLVFILRDQLTFKVILLLIMPLILSGFYVSFQHTLYIQQLGKIVLMLFLPLARLGDLFTSLLGSHFRNQRTVKYVAVGAILAVPFIFIVLNLLISSDLVLNQYVTDFMDRLTIDGEMIFRIIFVILFSSYLFAQKNVSVTEDMNVISFKGNTGIWQDNPHSTSGSSIVMITFLSIINMLYLLFVYIQIKYLFLHTGELPDGVSYAEYARDGFFQLLAVTVLNILVIILFEILNHQKLTALRTLEVTTLLMTVTMAISAFYRMMLYESTYGYTVLRLLVFLFLIFLILFMLLLSAYIITYQKMILNIVVVFMILYYISSSLFNVDGYVARENIERYYRTGEIDMYYLTNLSHDADQVVSAFILENNLLFETHSGWYSYDEFIKRGTSDRQWQSWNLNLFK